MKFILLAVALCIVAVAASEPRDLEGYTFAHYRAEFNKVYKSQVSLRSREAIFNQNLERIRAINA